jgi:hypothetical protein
VTTQDRTYATYYLPDVNGQKGHDQVLFHHPNGLCVVCLSELHPMCVANTTEGVQQTGGGGGGGRATTTTAAATVGAALGFNR